MRSLPIFLGLLASSVGHSISKRETFNDRIDELIEDYNFLMASGGMESFPIDDIREVTFEKKVSFIKLKASFSASGGTVSDLSTLQRTGDATLSATPTTVTITLHLGLRNLEVYYPKYEASLGKIEISGDIRLKVETNSVYGRFTFVFEDEESCSSRLDEMYVEALDGFRVEVSNRGPLGWVAEKIAEWVIRRFKDHYQQRMMNDVVARMAKRMQSSSICEFVRNI